MYNCNRKDRSINLSVYLHAKHTLFYNRPDHTKYKKKKWTQLSQVADGIPITGMYLFRNHVHSLMILETALSPQIV
jgi:hypothetical protein